MSIHIRRSNDRGCFDYGWLKTFHTFAFANYENPTYPNFRCLRALNENEVRPGLGFPVQAHHHMEIFSIILKGGLAHQDDLGNGSVIRPGCIQVLSAGQGMTHSEINASDQEPVHFYQIWITPHTKKLKPSYQKKHFDFKNQWNQWELILSSDGREGSLYIHQEIAVYLVTLEKGKTIGYDLKDQRHGWLQVMEGEVLLNRLLSKLNFGVYILCS
jgi:quercetin 2,3-dioxygenase